MQKRCHPQNIFPEQTPEKRIKEYWNNHDNINYYENIPLEIQQYFSVKGGLSDFSDLKIINNELNNAKAVLEIGAGYGRVLDYLLMQNKPYNKITAVERSKKFCNILRQKYPKDLDIIETDLLDFIVKQKYDLILWLWSGISDFNKKEQGYILQKLATCLSNNGTLIIDTFQHDLKPANATFSQNQSYMIQVSNCTLYGYIPSPVEIFNLAEISGFAKIKKINYLTSKQRPRYLYVLSKK